MSIQQRTWHGRFALALFALAGIGRACPSLCQAQIRFTGVNLAGAEFGVSNGNVHLPGTYVTDYIYPNAAEVDYYVGKGLNTFRLPFRWERLQHSQLADFDATELSRMDGFVNYATSQGAYVIIEPHNFQRYYPDENNFQSSSQGLVGSDVPDTAFADFWARLADHFKADSHVIFNLMNEPNALPTEQLVTSENAAIAAIRDTGATNLILVPGNSYTGAHSWTKDNYGTPNSEAMLDIVDSGNNFAFDMHQYLDFDRSGTHDTIAEDDVNRGVSELASATQWLQSNHLRGFLGEFAVANASIGSGTYFSNSDFTTHPQIGDETLVNMLDYIVASDDVWLGWAWWAGGPYWGNYMFTLDPSNLGQANETDRAAMGVLQPYLATVLPGDYNFDGLVNAADYTVWRDTRGATGAGNAADANFDGIVDEEDYDTWQANFGNTLPGPGAGSLAGAAVPEPAAICLLAVGSSILCVSARRYRPS